MSRHPIDKVKEMIKKKSWLQIKKYISLLHASEAAELLKEIDSSFRPLIFRSLPRKFSAKVFSYLDPDEQDDLLQALTKEETAMLLEDMSPDDRTELFEELPAEVTKRIFVLLSPEDLKETRHLLGYPPDSVGRVMTPDYISIRPEWTVEETLQHIKKNAKKSETADIVYIVDSQGKLLNEIKLHKLILAEPGKKVSEIISDFHLQKILATDDQENAVRLIKKYNRVALPVVDSDDVLLGIVTVDDLMDIEEEEVTEDFHKIAGLSSRVGDSVYIGNILDAPATFLYKRRIWWLLILVFMNVFSGAALAHFEDIISHVVKLVFFLPLLIGSGGNAGSQAATLVIRGLGTGDVRVSDWFKMIGKEVLVSGLLGVTMGAGVALLGFARGGIELVWVVALSMISIVVLGSVIGASLPFILTKFKKDPATASGPLIASISDIGGILVYFSIASWFLM